MIEIRHLRYFVVLAEELHFGRAAERLHMAQSPLSHQIMRLEKELGVELLSRSHHVVGLTDAGKAFQVGAHAVLDMLDDSVHLARRAGRGEVGTIRVGYVSDVTADLLPLILSAFKDRFPAIELELKEGTTGELLQGLRRGDLDVSFVRAPAVVQNLEYERLIKESLVLATPSGHPAGQHNPALASLAEAGFVMPTYESAGGLRRDIDGACEAAGVEPIVAREAGTLTAVLLLVAAGAGVALVPASTMHTYPVPGVRYAHLSPPPPLTSAGVAWRPDEPSLVIKNFLATTRGVTRQHEGEEDVWPERHVVDIDMEAPSAS